MMRLLHGKPIMKNKDWKKWPQCGSFVLQVQHINITLKMGVRLVPEKEE